jgi:hypothetical protein
MVRFVVWTLAVEAVLLVGLGVAGLVSSTPLALWAHSATAQTPTDVLGFRMNPLHSVLLIATGVLAVATLWQPVWRRRFAATQTIGYMLLYVFGLAFAANTPTATMWNLNTADHVLHGTLFVLGLTIVLMLYSSSFEPPIDDGRGADRPAEESRAGAGQVGR